MFIRDFIGNIKTNVVDSKSSIVIQWIISMSNNL